MRMLMGIVLFTSSLSVFPQNASVSVDHLVVYKRERKLVL
jgi:hypothetical protein